MKITALEEYGLRCMLLLAKSSEATLTLTDFSQREGLSVPYAGKLLMILKKAELVRAVRGRNGGYALTRIASEIYLKEIFDALGEPVFSPTHCQKYSGEEEICVHKGDCSVRDIWRGFGGLIGTVLERITLDDIASGNLDVIKNLQLVPVEHNQNDET
ncbi:MAG: Rrf2 family transcriptional regulator [candidate division Zixibacteria bacterium]